MFDVLTLKLIKFLFHKVSHLFVEPHFRVDLIKLIYSHSVDRLLIVMKNICCL